MAKIIMIHSFRRGVGRSTMIANSAALLALEGKRVGIIDTNIHSPALHFFFGLSEADIGCSLNHYLWGTCPLAQTAYNVTPQQAPGNVPGQVFLIPGTCQPHDMARVLSNSYSLHPLNAEIEAWCDELRLDVLLIDPRPGLIEMTLASIVMADTVVVLMRLDRQDVEGTAIILDLLRKIDVSEVLLVVNEVPNACGLQAIRKDVGKTLQHPVTAVVPHSAQLLALGSSGLFALRYPEDPLTDLYRQITNKFFL